MSAAASPAPAALVRALLLGLADQVGRWAVAREAHASAVAMRADVYTPIEVAQSAARADGYRVLEEVLRAAAAAAAVDGDVVDPVARLRAHLGFEALDPENVEACAPMVSTLRLVESYCARRSPVAFTAEALATPRAHQWAYESAQQFTRDLLRGRGASAPASTLLSSLVADLERLPREPENATLRAVVRFGLDGLLAATAREAMPPDVVAALDAERSAREAR